MAVEIVNLDRESIGQSNGTWSGTRVYTVRFDSLEFDTLDALTGNDGTTSVPAYGTAWAPNHSAKLASTNAELTDADPQQVAVTLTYSSDQSATIEANPLARPTQYSYDDQVITEAYFRDADEQPVVTSAGGMFQDLPQRQRIVGTLKLTRNVATYNDNTAEAARGNVNADSVTANGTTYGARKLLLLGWSATGPHIENGVTFWTETLTLGKRVDTWDDKFEDRDTHELASGKRKPILDAKNEPVVDTYPLDGSGAAQASPTTPPFELIYKPYASGNFPSLA